MQCRPHVQGRVELRGERVIFVASGRELDFPKGAEQIVRQAVSGTPLDLASSADELEWANRKIVLETLVREGFCSVKRTIDC